MFGQGVFLNTFFQKKHLYKFPKVQTESNDSACLHCCSFTGKEKDSETGFYYFGARYYDPALSGLFISVDPMSDKYPSISPYAYCAWNPVKLVDPDGDSVTVYGEQATDFVKQLQSKNISISINSEGRLNAALKSNDLSKEENVIYNAITSDVINITIQTGVSPETNEGIHFFYLKNDGLEIKVATPFGASFCGAYRNNKTGKVDTYSFIDVSYMESLGFDQGIPHEVSENYYAGLFVIEGGENIPFADNNKQNNKLVIAHRSAIPQTVPDGTRYQFGPRMGRLKLNKMKPLYEMMLFN